MMELDRILLIFNNYLLPEPYALLAHFGSLCILLTQLSRKQLILLFKKFLSMF